MQRKDIQNASILVVDDNPMNLSLLFEYLGRMGFEVSIAQTGENALTQAVEKSPDIILLDILMPDLDGFEICRRLKKNEETQDIPVIFMTALSDTEDTVRGFEVGGVDYITKPFKREEVLARIHTHLTLQRQRRELYELNAVKDTFFSIAAHDMRNALVPMIGLSNLLSDENFDCDNVQDIARKMDEYVQKAHRMLENLLYWGSLQTKKIEFQPENIDLHNILLEVRGLLRGYARKKQVTLSDFIEPGTFVCADRKMTIMIFRNLIMNGIKFTPTGGTVTVSAQKNDANTEVSITDTGIGIAAKHQKKLFKIDQKFSTVGTDGETGSGLGLILCKELLERNNGDISIVSEEKKGTICTFTLPAPIVQKNSFEREL